MWFSLLSLPVMSKKQKNKERNKVEENCQLMANHSYIIMWLSPMISLPSCGTLALFDHRNPSVYYRISAFLVRNLMPCRLYIVLLCVGCVCHISSPCKMFFVPLVRSPKQKINRKENGWVKKDVIIIISKSLSRWWFLERRKWGTNRIKLVRDSSMHYSRCTIYTKTPSFLRHLHPVSRMPPLNAVCLLPSCIVVDWNHQSLNFFHNSSLPSLPNNTQQETESIRLPWLLALWQNWDLWMVCPPRFSVTTKTTGVHVTEWGLG